MASLLRHSTRFIAPNVARTLLSFLGGLAVTWLVRRFGSGELLNEYVAVALVQALALQVLGWGMRDYLFKALAAQPSESRRILGEAFAGRAVLFVPLAALLFVSLLLAPGLGGWSILVAIVSVALRSIVMTLEPLVAFRRTYRFAAVAELPGTLFFALLFLLSGHRTLLLVLAGTVGADLIKLSLYALRFRADRPQPHGLLDGVRCLRRTFPFFLVAIAGYFVTRIDVYCMGFFIGRREIGQYHVLVNLLQALTLLLSSIPGAFSVTLLRAPTPTFRRAFRSFALASVVLVAAGVACIRLVMEHMYGLTMNAPQTVVAGLLTASFPFTLRSFYEITRHHSQHLITVALVGGGLGNLVVSMILIARLGVTGALLAAAVGQWTTYVLSVVLAHRHARLRHHHHA